MLPPELRTPVPGPESSRLSARLARVELAAACGLGPEGEPAHFWADAYGANVWDVDGNRFVDLTSGFGVALLGHRHPAVVQGAVSQANRLLHGLGDLAPHTPRLELAERLLRRVPIRDGRVYFAVSGADAVELALKVARVATGKPGAVGFEPAYHGLTLGALALSSRSSFKEPFESWLRRDLLRLPYGVPINELDARVAAASPAIGAVLVEPIVGREGVLLPPSGWLAELSRWAQRSQVLLLVDEILTGCGRTGSWSALEPEGVEPDLLCCGKALAGGLPLAAVVGRADCFEHFHAGREALHTGTFLAHPVACAAALAVDALLDTEAAFARARALEEQLFQPLLERAHASGADLRGRGAFWGIEFPEPERSMHFRARLFEAGVLVLPAGPDGRVTELLPPLVLSGPALEAVRSALECAFDVP